MSERNLLANTIWIVMLVVSTAVGLRAVVATEFDLSETLIGLLIIFASLMPIHSFLFQQEIHLGGFSLKPSAIKELRIFFFVGMVIMWLIGIGYFVTNLQSDLLVHS